MCARFELVKGRMCVYFVEMMNGVIGQVRIHVCVWVIMVFWNSVFFKYRVYHMVCTSAKGSFWHYCEHGLVVFVLFFASFFVLFNYGLYVCVFPRCYNHMLSFSHCLCLVERIIQKKKVLE